MAAKSAHGASLTLTQADVSVDPTLQALLFYLFCDDVAAMYAAP